MAETSPRHHLHQIIDRIGFATRRHRARHVLGHHVGQRGNACLRQRTHDIALRQDACERSIAVAHNDGADAFAREQARGFRHRGVACDGADLVAFVAKDMSDLHRKPPRLDIHPAERDGRPRHPEPENPFCPERFAGSAASLSRPADKQCCARPMTIARSHSRYDSTVNFSKPAIEAGFAHPTFWSGGAPRFSWALMEGLMGFTQRLTMGAIVVVVLFLLFGINGTWYTVDQGERAVLLRWGQAVGEEGPGLHFKMPFIEDVVKMSVREQKEEFKTQAYSQDQQPATVQVSVNYRLPEANVMDI